VIAGPQAPVEPAAHGARLDLELAPCCAGTAASRSDSILAMLSDQALTKGKGVRLGIATPTGNSTPSNLALTHAAGQLGVSAQNALAASAAKHYEGRGAVRAALGRGNPELSGLVPAVTAPDSLTIRSGSLRRMSRRPGAKGRRDRLSSVSNSPTMGSGLVCGGAPQTQAPSMARIFGEIRHNSSGRVRL